MMRCFLATIVFFLHALTIHFQEGAAGSTIHAAFVASPQGRIGGRTKSKSDLSTVIFEEKSSIQDEASSASSFKRAAEITQVLGGQVMTPLLWSIFVQGLPGDGGWDEFWSRKKNGVTNAERLSRAMEKLGPTYVKFGQALGSRPDVVPPSLSDALSSLQDNMQPFDTDTARQIILNELTASNSTNSDNIKSLVNSLSEEPVAAASVGQVYKAVLPDFGTVAIKVQRPGIRELVERDAALLHTLGTWIESIPALPMKKQGHAKRLINTDVLAAADEFMSRVFEELDYKNEAHNAETFARLYSIRDGTSPDVSVVVPEILPDYCTENVLTMEWVDGTKLTNVAASEPSAVAENLALIEIAIQATLSQLLVTGVLHADPHAGNLLKVGTEDDAVTLGYLDFGLLSTIPESVRDALVCSVAYLVFARDIDAVATLFGELQLLPAEVIEDEEERAALAKALETTMAEALVYPTKSDEQDTQIPELRFDKLLDALTKLVPRFNFQLPPYFINNARALSTLEGIAKTLDPSFNVLQVLYPYALNRLLQNPSGSKVVDGTVQSLIRSPDTKRVDAKKVNQILRDSALLTGFRKRRVIWDVLRTRGGRRLARRIGMEEFKYRVVPGSAKKDRTEPRRTIFRILQL